MQLVSVNVSRPLEVEHEGRRVRTGIFKRPVAGRVQVGAVNLEGDGQADLAVHGGADKAVYVYPGEHYDAWKRELQRDDLSPGQFGENFTLQGILEDDMHVGDELRIGTARFVVTQPRVPCFKLGIKMGSQDFVRRFLESERSGWYLRVLETGDVGAGDAVSIERVHPERVSVRAIHRLVYGAGERDLDLARRALRVAPLAAGWRKRCEAIAAGTATAVHGES